MEQTVVLLQDINLWLHPTFWIYFTSILWTAASRDELSVCLSYSVILEQCSINTFHIFNISMCQLFRNVTGCWPEYEINYLPEDILSARFNYCRNTNDLERTWCVADAGDGMLTCASCNTSVCPGELVGESIQHCATENSILPGKIRAANMSEFYD